MVQASLMYIFFFNERAFERSQEINMSIKQQSKRKLKGKKKKDS